jgi:hypothetical protein
MNAKYVVIVLGLADAVAEVISHRDALRYVCMLDLVTCLAACPKAFGER